jgi:hypothetical protein
MTTGDDLQRAHDYQKWLDDNNFGRPKDAVGEAMGAVMVRSLEHAYANGRADNAHGIRDLLLKSHHLTIQLSTGDYISVRDMLDIIDTATVPKDGA